MTKAETIAIALWGWAQLFLAIVIRTSMKQFAVNYAVASLFLLVVMLSLALLSAS